LNSSAALCESAIASHGHWEKSGDQTAKNAESDEIHKENRTPNIEKNNLDSFARLLSRGEA
jgi:hypothetical protein